MGFRDAVTADLATFLNVDEFAASVDVDGAEVDCILDETEAVHTAEGVSLREFALHVRASDLDPTPVVDQRMTIAGRQADVVHVDEAQGLLVLRMRWLDS